MLIKFFFTTMKRTYLRDALLQFFEPFANTTAFSNRKANDKSADILKASLP